MPSDDDKVYLGDGVYAHFESLNVVLTTENGIVVTNRIVLEPDVLDVLDRWIQRRFRAGKLHANEKES